MTTGRINLGPRLPPLHLRLKEAASFLACVGYGVAIRGLNLVAICLLGSWPLWRDHLISVPGGSVCFGDNGHLAAAALIKRALRFFSKPQIRTRR